MTLELNDYGLEFDTYVAYIALSWQVSKRLVDIFIFHSLINLISD